MIYDKKQIVKLIVKNIENINKEIESMIKAYPINELADISQFRHLMQWKDTNMNSLFQYGHITLVEMQKYFDKKQNYLFTPEITY